MNSWPHPMRDTETDPAAVVAASLGWNADGATLTFLSDKTECWG